MTIADFNFGDRVVFYGYGKDNSPSKGTIIEMVGGYKGVRLDGGHILITELDNNTIIDTEMRHAPSLLVEKMAKELPLTEGARKFVKNNPVNKMGELLEVAKLFAEIKPTSNTELQGGDNG